MKAKARTNTRATSRSPGSSLWLLGLVCGAVATLATPVALLALALLAPGLGSLLLEREPGRPLSRITLLCGAAAAAGPLASLWQSGQGVAGAFAAAADTRVLAGSWAAQAGGWLLGQIAPLVIRLLLDARAATEATRLRSRRRALETEWGIPPPPTAR
jgi:hypothetical protein